MIDEVLINDLCELTLSFWARITAPTIAAQLPTATLRLLAERFSGRVRSMGAICARSPSLIAAFAAGV